MWIIYLIIVSCCRTAVGVGQRALSLRPHGGGTPSPLLAPGRVTSSCQLFGVCPVLLWRRCYVERVVLTIWVRASTPSFTLEVLVAGTLSAAAVASGVDGMDPGAWRWRRTCTSSPLNTSQCGYADTEGDIGYALWTWLRWYLKFRIFKSGTGSYGQGRLTLVLDVPPATSTCAYPVYVHHSLTLYVSFCPGRLQRLGTTPTTAGPGRQAWRLCGARRRLTSDVESACLSSCWLHLGDTRPGPHQNFSSPPESPTDALLTSRRLTPSTAQLTWFIYSILIAIVIVIIAIISLVIFIIVTVRPLFMQNIYLSLFCDWIIFFLKIIFFSFFQVCSWSMWSQN
jgi:hypothetical protein